MGRFIPPDHSKGDESTVGGYHAVHGRPPALEGPDGMSYSVDIGVADTGEPRAPLGAYLLFVQWSAGQPSVSGHLETDFLVQGTDEDALRRELGSQLLTDAERMLDALVRSKSAPERPWWEVMRDS